MSATEYTVGSTQIEFPTPVQFFESLAGMGSVLDMVMQDWDFDGNVDAVLSTQAGVVVLSFDPVLGVIPNATLTHPPMFHSLANSTIIKHWAPLSSSASSTLVSSKLRPGADPSVDHVYLFIQPDLGMVVVTSSPPPSSSSARFMVSPSTTSAMAVELGDFDGDNVPDAVVVPSQFNLPFTVFLGLTVPSIESFTLPLVELAFSVQLEDVNADGWVDLVAGAYGTTAGNIFVLYSRGGSLVGSPWVRLSSQSGSTPAWVLTSELVSESPESSRAIMLGNAMGTIRLWSPEETSTEVKISTTCFGCTVKVGTEPVVHFVVADLNGDYINDVVYVQTPDESVRVSYGAADGSGPQQVPAVIETGTGISMVAVADLFSSSPSTYESTGSVLLDILGVNMDTQTVLFAKAGANGYASFAPLLSVPTPSEVPFSRYTVSLLALDAEFDGLVDIALFTPVGAYLVPGTVLTSSPPPALPLAVGDPGVVPIVFEGSETQYGVAKLAHVNADSYLDLVVMTNGTAQGMETVDVVYGFWLLGPVASSLDASSFVVGAHIPPFMTKIPMGEEFAFVQYDVADVSGDGVGDLIAVEGNNLVFYTAHTSNASLVVPGSVIGSTGSERHTHVTVRDVDRQGKPVVYFQQDSAIAELVYNSRIEAWSPDTAFSETPNYFAFGDVSNDGVPDLIMGLAMGFEGVIAYPSPFSLGLPPPQTLAPLPYLPGRAVTSLGATLGPRSACWPARVTLSPELVVDTCPSTKGLLPPESVSWTVSGPGTLDCGEAGGVLFGVSPSSHVMLENLQVTRGTAGSDSEAPSPLWVGSSGSLTLQGVIVTNCSTVSTSGSVRGAIFPGYGGVIAVMDNARVTLADSVFESNTAGDGGGVVGLIGSQAELTVASTVLRANTATGSSADISGGGAIAVLGSSSRVVVKAGSRVESNVAFSGSGGGLFVGPGSDGTTVVLRDGVVVAGNTAGRGGGAVAVVAGASVQVVTEGVVSFSGGSATWGGCFSVVYSGFEFPSPVDSNTLVLSRSSPGSDSVFDTSVVLSSETSVVSCSAQFGGLAFACGAGIDASAMALPGGEGGVGGIARASVGGHVGFGCVLEDGSPPAEGWVGLGAGVVSDPVFAEPPQGGYGGAWASPLVSLSLQGADGDLRAASGLTMGDVYGGGSTPWVSGKDAFGHDVRGAQGLASVAMVENDVSGSVVLSGAALGLSMEASTGRIGLGPLVLSRPPAASSSSPDGDMMRVVISVSMGMVGTSFPVVVGQCPAGYGSVESVTSSDVLVCGVCSAGSFSTEESSEPCSPVPDCPENGRRNATDGVSCLCKDGFFLAGGLCLNCPPGGLCVEGTDPPVAAPGFFPAENGAFIRCRRGSGCLGRDGCAQGYEGYMCNTCSQGYFSTSEGDCAKCPDAPETITSSGMGVVVVLAVVAGVGLAASAHKSRKEGEVKATTAAAGGEERGQSSGLRTRMVPASIGMAILAAQITGVLADASFSWSDTSQRVFGAFNVFNVDASIIRTECSVGSFYTSYMVSVGLPLVFLVVVVGTVVFVGKVVLSRSSGGLGATSVREMVDVVLFTVAPLVYIPIARAAFVMFDCAKLPSGDWVLDADPGVPCFESGWFSALPLGMLATLGFVIVVPVYFFVSVYHVRRSLLVPAVFARYGGLVRLWRVPFWYGEIAGLIKRLLIVGVSVFLSDHVLAQIGLLLAILLTGALLVKSHRPYYFLDLNTVDVQISLSLTFVLLLGGANYAERNADSATYALDWGAVVAVCVLIGVCVRGIGVEVRAIVGQRARVGSAGQARLDWVVGVLEAEMVDLDGGVEDVLVGVVRAACVGASVGAKGGGGGGGGSSSGMEVWDGEDGEDGDGDGEELSSLSE